MNLPKVDGGGLLGAMIGALFDAGMSPAEIRGAVDSILSAFAMIEADPNAMAHANHAVDVIRSAAGIEEPPKGEEEE